MKYVECKTQEEVNAAVARGDGVRLTGTASAVLRGNASAELWGNASAELRGNASAVLRGNASAVLRGNASAVLRGNASAELWGNASVKASCFSFVRAHGGTVEAGPNVMVMVHSDAVKVMGGIIHRVKNPATPSEWCAHYGVEVKDGVAILFKGVDQDFRSPLGTHYTPGTIPVAPDWDGGIKECGGGLHFSPHPSMTREFCDPVRLVACPVALSDIAVHPDGEYPQKVKARGCCAPVYEVNEQGARIVDGQ